MPGASKLSTVARRSSRILSEQRFLPSPATKALHRPQPVVVLCSMLRTQALVEPDGVGIEGAAAHQADAPFE